MRAVSATDIKRRLAAILDAGQQEPVIIRRRRRDVAVLLSRQEYDRLRGTVTAGAEAPAPRALAEDDLANMVADEDGG